jgi:hypothetical protein
LKKDQGYRDKDGNIWKKDKLHKDHWELEGTPVWNSVDRAIKALLKNGDVELTTRREYVVGYICHKIRSS